MKGSQFSVTNWDQSVMGPKYNSSVGPKSSNDRTKIFSNPSLTP